MEIFVAILFIAFIALVVFIRRKKPTWKGKFSERLVFKELLRLPDEYNIFNDLFFRSNGCSTQIDHVIVSPYGVFVIETKGYKGWILGGENSQYWTQTLYRSKYRFYNPIKQNDGHVRFLRYLLKCEVDIPFIPIVVFNNDADLKVLVKNHIVVNRCDLIEAIRQYQSPVLDKTIIDWIVETIKARATVADNESMEQHIDTTARRQLRVRNYIQQGICPLCGGKLILRQGRYGTFYGCSNYPQCKFTQSE